MEIARILKILWRRRFWVAAGVAVAAFVAWSTTYRVTFPPSLEPKSIEFGSATTQVLLDAGRSPLTDLELDISPLATRAQVYARLVESEPAQLEIARAADLQLGEIIVTGQIASQGFTRASREPAAEQRAQQLAAEAHARRLLFAAEEDLPVLSIYAQAATPEEAIRIADAGAEGLIDYVDSLEESRLTRQEARVQMRQLGVANGGWVNQGASKTLAMLALLGTLGLWCFLVLLGSNLVANLRRAESPASCANCGLELADDVRFCPRCGASSAPAPSAGPVQPTADTPETPRVASARRSA